MSNLPPEHRNPEPDDEPEQNTGSFPAVDEELVDPGAGYFEPDQPGSQDPTQTGQFPAFGGQQIQDSSHAYFIDRNTGEQQIIESDPAQRFGPADPNGDPEPFVERPAMYETGELDRTGQQFQPGPETVFEPENPTAQAGLELPDVQEVGYQGPSTAVADAVALPPVSQPNIEIPQDGTHPPVLDESDIDGYLDTEDIDADLPARVRRKLAKKARPESTVRRRKTELDADSGWSYLMLLGLLFVLIVGFSLRCQQVSEADQSAARNPTLAAEVNVVIRVGGDQVSLSGALPDEKKASDLVALVAEHYETDLITNALSVDGAISIDDSVLEITGQAQEGDTRPEELQTTLDDRFDIQVASSTVNYGTLPENLVAVSVEVSGASVVISGTVPDQAKLDLIKLSAESVWGVDDVDTSSLAVGDVVWSGGRVSVSGEIPLGSSEPGEFADLIRLEGIFVDPGRSDNDIANATPDELKAAVAQRFEVAPITFSAGKQTLTDSDEKTLDGVAQLLLALPDEEITIVGHSDSGGESAAARELAALRARIVWAYLTQKTGLPDSIENSGSATDSTSKITVTFG